MSYRSKLLLAGLIFPTILLIFAAIYITRVMPQVRFVDRFMKTSEHENGRLTTSFSGLTMRIDYPLIEKSESEFPDWKFKYFGDVVSIATPFYSFTPQDLKDIGTFQKLEWMVLSPTKEVAADDFAHLCSLKRLKLLSVTNAINRELLLSRTWYPITDEHLNHISQIENLERLTLSTDNSKITPAGIQKLSRLRKLNELTIRSFPLTAEHLQALRSLASLKSLNLGEVPMDAETVRLLSQLTVDRLQIDIRATVETDLHQLASIPSLDSLEIRNTMPLAEDAFDGFADFPKLQTLTLSNHSFSEPLIQNVASIKTLRTLRFTNTTIPASALKQFAEHPNLKTIHLQHVRTDASLAEIQQWLPNVNIDSMNLQTIRK